ncbi:TlpA family protein disulfide reductase [Hyunsoonleella pacifica]|uniref:TlpA family protein disulfide reductase n=1 Tax=Hyunsoonleella pacifica TaxID=1080224 RepID=A0A4Q9FLS0_9FLAO|nr:TlpA disulfide reductase family protein [Hyunsoonleella pacifica]TBN14327.1 TlpA family protein disulfide reductase [Hyunsoonleella pacifica]GGD12815.1 hypothetical protein GCM10011368_13510 [Hyunsoonleella pacifica]
MKKLVLILFLQLLYFNIFSQNIIENPNYGFSSFPGKLTKIELNETRTVLHFYLKYYPGRSISIPKKTFIQDVKDEEKLFLTKAVGVELGKKIVLPSSGELYYALHFPRLKSDTQIIDFLEGTGSAAWKVYNISLNTKKPIPVPKDINLWINSELSKVTNKPIENYSSSKFFNKKPARIVGYIKGYTSRLKFNSGLIYTGNDITREQYPVVIPIAEDGRFEVDVPLLNPFYTYVVFNNTTFKVYLEPEQTLGVLIEKDIEFKGPLTKINQDLKGFELNRRDYPEYRKDLKRLTPEEFKDKQQHFYNQNLKKLNNYLGKNDVLSKSKILLNNLIMLDNAAQLFDFIMDRKNIARKDSTNNVVKVPEKNDYYDFLQDIDFNDQSLLALDKFSHFINRYEYTKHIFPKRKSNKGFKPKKTFLEYLNSESVPLSKEEMVLAERKENIPKEERKKFYQDHKEKIDAFELKFKKERRAYLDEYYDKYLNRPKMEKWRLRDSVLVNGLKVETSGLINEVVKIRALENDIKRTNSKYALEYWTSLEKGIEHPFVKAEGQRVLNKLFPSFVTKNGLDHKGLSKINLPVITTRLPEGKAKDIFRNIVDVHKGKILFVDFWATSCGPCVGSIKRMKETRAKYKDNEDFDFVFITDERSSPQKRYDAFVKDQELNNIYRLTLDDYNYLRQLFKFNGIPRYVVLDKKGDVINDNFPMHNFNYLLPGILDKYK